MHVDQQYLELVTRTLEDGVRKPSRGASTLSSFGQSIRVDLADGFPLLTTKKISWKSVLLENLWFLSGKRHIRGLQAHGIKFWDKWVSKMGFVPSAYGDFWRNFDRENQVFTGGIDQMAYVLEKLKNDPGSRRMVVSAWDPRNAHHSTLPPCHILQVYHTEKIEGDWRHWKLNLHVTQRSADIAVGVPFNIAGYAFILSTMAKMANMVPGELMITFVDAHVYAEDPVDHRPGLLEQIGREPTALPKLTIDSSEVPDLYVFETMLEDYSTQELLEIFKLEGYDPHPRINFEVQV